MRSQLMHDGYRVRLKWYSNTFNRGERTMPVGYAYQLETLLWSDVGVSPCHPNGGHVPTNPGDYDTSFVDMG